MMFAKVLQGLGGCRKFCDNLIFLFIQLVHFTDSLADFFNQTVWTEDLEAGTVG